MGLRDTHVAAIGMMLDLFVLVCIFGYSYVTNQKMALECAIALY